MRRHRHGRQRRELLRNSGPDRTVWSRSSTITCPAEPSPALSYTFRHSDACAAKSSGEAAAVQLGPVKTDWPAPRRPGSNSAGRGPCHRRQQFPDLIARTNSPTEADGYQNRRLPRLPALAVKRVDAAPAPARSKITLSRSGRFGRFRRNRKSLLAGRGGKRPLIERGKNFPTH